MTTENYVSFETAKLLDANQFYSDECTAIYDNGDYGTFVRDSAIFDYGAEDYLQYMNGDEWKRFGYYLAPTLQMAMKWLREEHNLHCDISYDFRLGWCIQITSLKEVVQDHDIEMKTYLPNKAVNYPSYEDACEEAIRYCLENLI